MKQLRCKFIDMDSDADGTVEGYASVFGVPDLGNDVMMPGAFSQSIASGRRVKMLREHNPADLIGVWDIVGEDAKGLHVKGNIVLETVAGREAHALVRAGALDGISIGYQTKRSNWNATTEKRELIEVDLWEVSLVAFPMQVEAQITGVKKLAADGGPTIREFEKHLRDVGFSKSVAAGMAGKCSEFLRGDPAGGADGETGADLMAALLKTFKG